MSHTANTAHTEPTTRRAARRGAVEDLVVTEDGRVLNDPTHLELPGHGNAPGAWAMVALVLVGFVAGCVGLLADWSVVVWIGVALMAVGVVVGIVAGKARAGRGQHGH
ncbi:HGxxPAAW family protein [Micrococcus luteus]|uniref:HGxxPAAW family protein n=1 Tax=Micrococcus luteus TaxID=1270 RepID=UPI0015D92457|nr:HGxxPAAW family protein [Micrococcus luteus]